MRSIKNLFNLLIVLLIFLLCGCSQPSTFSDLKLSLENTINQISDDYDLNNITENINFKQYENNEYEYQWLSSDQTIITNNGEVTRYFKDKQVIITIKIYLNDLYYQDSFNCTVIKKETDGYTFDLNNTKSFLTIFTLNKVEEDLPYNNHLDVIAYIYYFQKLPSNYLTKSAAKQLGWKGSGNVWVDETLKGKNIGGDTFNNYEQLLPLTESNTYVEVDVNCSNGSRGKYRIVYNRYTFDIYYTDDHYNSFTYMIGVLQ